MSTQLAVGVGTAARPAAATPARIGLFGCGTVGAEVARLLRHQPRGRHLRITRALVREPSRRRPADLQIPFTRFGEHVLSDAPDVVVELLGGCEPARSLVLESLSRRIPAVTANKSLLARHGRELREAAITSQTPLLYEASVLAGVPFLGTFARRPLAAAAHGFVGILNGTTNFVLTQSALRGVTHEAAVAEAQRLGYAEPDPSSDITGIDAAEKLVVLLAHFAALHVAVDSVEIEAIDVITPLHHRVAADLGGSIKPVVTADWSTAVQAAVGPAFVPAAHALQSVNGVDNALLLHTPRGRLLFQGAGAGPLATAATVIDDVHEIVAGVARPPDRALTPAATGEPRTGWLVTLTGVRLPPSLELADYLSSHGIYIRRSTDRHSAEGRDDQAFLTWPVGRDVIKRAAAGIEAATGVSATVIRALEVER